MTTKNLFYPKIITMSDSDVWIFFDGSKQKIMKKSRSFVESIE